MNIEINQNKNYLFDTMRIYSTFTIGLEIKNFNKTRILLIIDDFSNDLTSLIKFQSMLDDTRLRYERLMEFSMNKDNLYKYITDLIFIYKYIDEKIEIIYNETRYYLK